MESSSPEGQRAVHGGFRRTYRIAGSVLLALTIAAATLTLVLVERWESGAGSPAGLDGAEAGREAGSPFTATMYYVAGDGLGLVRREIDVPYAPDPLLRARIVVERQLERPPRRLLSPFPSGTRLRAVYLADDGNLFVDLSGEVTTQHSGGSLDELLTVYALVNAVTTNVHEVAAVQILVEGGEVDTLAGHIDLRQPLTPNLTWVVDLPPPDGESPAADDRIQPPDGAPPDESGGPDEPGAPAPGDGPDGGTTAQPIQHG
jgi:hypothetical protein